MPPILKWTKYCGNPKTIVLHFADLMLKDPPERSIGAQTAPGPAMLFPALCYYSQSQVPGEIITMIRAPPPQCRVLDHIGSGDNKNLK
ncbi:MAG: hypothetical protein E4H16_02215 [Candidatus Atribacteria bacterium]|nr:MAG: hypothetical protein E4H16_02215 [Candidatus Atribacteria bacterium]